MAGPVAGDVTGSPLGREQDYAGGYDPSRLYPIARADSRSTLTAAPARGFHGVDWWTAFELSWLDGEGRPQAAVGRFAVPADSPCIVESKSLKLYLNSFANTRFPSREAVIQTIAEDLARVAGAPVDVRVMSLEEAGRAAVWDDHGDVVDHLDVAFDDFEYRPELLLTEQGPERNGVLVSHLLRSHCPVTNQPDWATVQVRYTGAAISPASFLRYVVSLRNHQGFHEQIIEQMFVDLKRQCAPRHLSVYGRFTRRGGLDINPFRSDYEDAPTNRRTVRQ